MMKIDDTLADIKININYAIMRACVSLINETQFDADKPSSGLSIKKPQTGLNIKQTIY